MIHLNSRLFGAARPWAQNLLIIGGSLAAGALSHYLVEQPFLRLKRRLADRRPEPAVPAPATRAAA